MHLVPLRVRLVATAAVSRVISNALPAERGQRVAMMQGEVVDFLLQRRDPLCPSQETLGPQKPGVSSVWDERTRVESTPLLA